MEKIVVGFVLRFSLTHVQHATALSSSLERFSLGHNTIARPLFLSWQLFIVCFSSGKGFVIIVTIITIIIDISNNHGKGIERPKGPAGPRTEREEDGKVG